MSKPNEERDIYYIPPNFLASGRLFGGMIRARNAIEACVLVLLTGIPIIKLPMSLTVRIIILCLLPLPLGIFGIIGFEGDSLSEFAINWVRWFIHRRNLYRSDVTIPETARKQKKRIWEQEATKPPEELGIRIKQPRKKRKRPAKTEKQLNKNNRKMVPSHKKQVTYSEDFVPVKDIRNGIIEMEDGRYIRVLEVEPINFLLRSTSEQKNIVASFASWMKISPIKIQIKVLTKKADIGKHLSTIERDMESESNPKCRELQLDYYRLIQTIGSREAITRRFLVIFEYEAVSNRKPEYSEIVSALETTVQTARQYFLHCDNAVVTHDDENAFLLEILYTIFNRSTCEVKTVEQRIRELQSARWDADITMPVSLKSVFAPDSIDLTHGSYVVMDGVYHAYLIVPSDGYNPRVVAGWTSILVNAGEGIDVDFYFSREPKERIQAKLGQQIRINRSRLKDTSDTNSDFDDFESAIRSGYFLKEGLANYEDFYYCNTLVTITADTLENLEWRISEVRRLMVSQDSEEAKWGYLAGAVRRQQILTGIVSAGMTYTENGMPIVPIDFEGLCVKIPVREMTLIEWPEDEPIPRSVRVQIGRMLGATIDFIPAGVDFKERVAIGSRKAAMLQRQKLYYASGRVKPGILMACRVLTVGNNTMMVEACGVDTEIYARNVSWEWFSDIADLYSTGDLVVARVLDVTYNEQRDTYAVNLSIKDASENPDRAALEKIVPNSNYFGVVTGVKDRVFFVRLQAGVNAKTKLYRSIDMPSRLDTVSFRVTRVDEENGIALGFITRIIKRHTRLR